MSPGAPHCCTRKLLGLLLGMTYQVPLEGRQTEMSLFRSPSKSAVVMMPVPTSGTVCGLPAALSVMLIEAVRVPVAVGAKVTLIVQVAPAATEAPQVFVCAKSPLFVPVMAMLEIINAAVPVLDRLTICTALVLPTRWPPKLILAPPNTTIGATPVPVSETTCGLPAALSVMVTAPLRVPLSVGVNVTLTVQLAPMPTVVPQLLVCTKSPEAAMLGTVSGASPVLESMNCWAL